MRRRQPTRADRERAIKARDRLQAVVGTRVLSDPVKRELEMLADALTIVLREEPWTRKP